MKILVIDIETTDFLKRGGFICEIGIIQLNLETGEKKVLFDHVVHEKGMTKEHVEKAWIIQNSSLTVEEIRHSKCLDFYILDIQDIINDHPAGVTAFNRSFDCDFLEDRGFYFPKKLPCPMLLSTDICKLPGRFGNDFKWPRVEEAYKFFFPDSKYIELHRGADDAKHEADIVLELYKRKVFKL